MAKAMILGLLAETSLHPGSGQATGVIDLPVSREGATGLPQVPDTSLKGALRAWAVEKWPKQKDGQGHLQDDPYVKHLFGTADDGAGALLISTARLLFLPVRRLDGPYAWVTTPYLLERLGRDAARSGIKLDVPAMEVSGEQFLTAKAPDASDTRIYLEEYVFTPKALENKDEFSIVVGALIGKRDEGANGGGVKSDTGLVSRLMDQAAVMSDSEFAWFAENALPVDARNSLDDSKMSTSLWYEETLPPDTLLYAVILPRTGGADEAIAEFVKTINGQYLQVGGNETVGQGWVRVTVLEAAS